MLAIQTDLYIYTCSSHRWIRLFILGLLYTFFGIFQTIALYLALQISKVKVKGLNDAKYTAAAVYVITILAMVLAIVALVFNLTDYINVSASIYGIVVWLSGTSILGFVFIPKVLNISKSVFSAYVQNYALYCCYCLVSVGASIND